jgi:hypothetical protein
MVKYELTEDEMTTILNTTKFLWMIKTLEDLERMGKLSHKDVEDLRKPLDTKFMEHQPKYLEISKNKKALIKTVENVNKKFIESFK